MKSLVDEANKIEAKKRKIDVRGCARCGKDHDGLAFRALDNPADNFNWWAICPTTAQPIILAIGTRSANDQV